MSAIITDTSKRDLAIVIANRNGLSYARIGRLHGITRSRVQQIVAEAERKAAIRNTPACELSTRVRNAIQNEGCPATPEAVADRFTLRELRQVPNIGVACIAELNAWLVRHGRRPIT